MITLSRFDLSAASRPPVRAKNGMVVAAESLATAAGVDILKRGGNAIDAAVAVGFALAVTFPEAGNIGGGGFMLIRLANGKSAMIDFREKAPGAAFREMYLDTAGNHDKRRSEHGSLAAGVPGAVAGYLKALDDYGTMHRSEVMKRSIELADAGFPLSERLASSLILYSEQFAEFPAAVQAFTDNGTPLMEGVLFRQPDLAKTLRLISNEGKRGFYSGAVADLIVREMKRSGGIITHHDLESYEPVERMPLFGEYRGHQIITASPPSAGGIVLLQFLNMLEQFDLQSIGHNSSRYIHLFAAAAQRAYADRATYLGDPDFVSVPVSTLISKEYARARVQSIDLHHATPSGEIAAGVLTLKEGGETTHYCVADQFGNVVSATVTLNSLYGCKNVVDGAGFFLNNEMDDFVAKPGSPNLYGLVGAEANSIVPHKRMLSSMTPTIVMKDGEPYILAGARGGSRISTAVAQIILNVIDFGMDIQQAVDAPRFHHQWLPDKLDYEPHGLVKDVEENLQRMGYLLEKYPDFNGKAEALMIQHSPRVILGGPDPREMGVGLGF